MEGVDSPLDVLSLAATMIQDRSLPPSYEEARKELPSSRWRKERRSNARESPLLPDYAAASANVRELADAPLDMSTRSRVSPRVAERERAEKEKEREKERAPTTRKQARGAVAGSGPGTRGSPPSYSEAISSKSGFRLSTPLARPSVITCTPLSSTSPNTTAKGGPAKQAGVEISSDDGMCDPVIDEHFRRSLGKDYMTLFAKKTTKSIPSSNPQDSENRNRRAITGLSVDDHFAKALGDTWLKLQAESTDTPVTTKSSGKESSSSTIPRQRRGVVTI